MIIWPFHECVVVIGWVALIGCNQPSATVWVFLWTLKASVPMWQVSSQSYFSITLLNVSYEWRACVCLRTTVMTGWIIRCARPMSEEKRKKKEEEEEAEPVRKKHGKWANLGKGEEEEERLRRQWGRVEVSSIAYKLIEKSDRANSPGGWDCCRLRKQSFLPVLQGRINCIKKPQQIQKTLFNTRVTIAHQ